MKTIKQSVQTLLFSVFLIAFNPQSKAEDIELYVNYDANSGEKPRVVIIFDTSGSMQYDANTGKACKDWRGTTIMCPNSRLAAAKKAMKDLVTANPDIEFSLMRFRGGDGGEGGYVLSGLGASHSSIKNKIDVLPADSWTPLSETLYESFRYLTGGKVDQAKNASGRDYSIEKRKKYKSPFKPKVKDGKKVLRCDNSINMLLMTDGDPMNDSYNNSDIYSLFPNGKKPSSIYGNYLHALAGYMYNHDLYKKTPDVKDIARTYTIGFGSGMSSNGKYLLEQTAKNGGGQYLHANSADELSEALKKAITSIREVNDTFTAPSIATNNLDRTQSDDSLYYAMFYPETGARWKGNIKKLKLVDDAIVDASSPPQAAIDENGGIAKEARTYWLPSDEAADGNVVLAGGTNLFLSKIKKRNLFSNFGANSALYELSVEGAAKQGISEKNLATQLSVEQKEVRNLLSWASGVDVDDENNNGSTTDKRIDIMGDPLHSKPVAIKYGDNDVRILVGTNAGFVHMFKDANDTVTESWGFIPYELFPILTHLRQETKDKKVYGMDLTPAIYFDDVNDDGVVNGKDRVWAFFGMRRGGQSYYALDITNPDAPKLMWTLSNTSAGFKELGQTWSKPSVAYIKLDGYTGVPLLVFGGGYDINKDDGARTPDSKGRGVFIVDAKSGGLVWSFAHGGRTSFIGQHSIASDIATLDSDYDGYVDRLYASDTAGAIWRFDLIGDQPGSHQTPWSVFKLAQLGDKATSQDRRFFYQPAIARTYFSKVTESSDGTISRAETPFEAIVIGSGNRSHPTYTTTSDHLYMIRDEHTVTKSFKTNPPKTILVSDLKSVNSDPFGGALDSQQDFVDLEVEFSKFKGWFYTLGTGEKALSAANIAGGVAYYSTFTPNSPDSVENQCSLAGGGGLLYAFHLHYGTKVYTDLAMDLGDSVPDTSQIVFDKDTHGNSQILLVGVGAGENGTGVIKAKSINNSLVPVDNNGDGKIDLVSPEPFGLKTIRNYIYRREEY